MSKETQVQNESDMDLEVNLSFAERTLKQMRCNSVEDVHEYCDLRFLLSTSNICERLFSVASHALNCRRKGIALVMFEARCPST